MRSSLIWSMPMLPVEWDPTQDANSASLLLLPDGYDGAGTWTDVSSGGNHAVTRFAATDPGVPGDSLGATFDGVGDCLEVPMSLADNVSYPGASLASPTGGSIIIVASQDILEADGGDYFNQAFITGDGATPGMYLTDAGAKMVGYDGTTYVTAAAGSPAAAAWHQIIGKWDDTGLYVTYDGLNFASGDFESYNAPPDELSVGNIGPKTLIGTSYAQLFAGTIRCIAVYPYAIDDAKRLQWYNWATAQGLFS